MLSRAPCKPLSALKGRRGRTPGRRAPDPRARAKTVRFCRFLRARRASPSRSAS